MILSGPGGTKKKEGGEKRKKGFREEIRSSTCCAELLFKRNSAQKHVACFCRIKTQHVSTCTQEHPRSNTHPPIPISAPSRYKLLDHNTINPLLLSKHKPNACLLCKSKASSGQGAEAGVERGSLFPPCSRALWPHEAIHTGPSKGCELWQRKQERHAATRRWDTHSPPNSPFLIFPSFPPGVQFKETQACLECSSKKPI